MKTNTVIIKPLVTEKATQMSGANTYAFEVARDATKPQIATLLEKLYKVKVATVTTTNRKGKVKNVGKARKEKQMPTRKIAYITLSEGKLDVIPKS